MRTPNQATGSQSQATNYRSRRRTFSDALLAFTLIEIMVVVVLLSVIVLGLMAMFSQTQRAFRAGMSQTDMLEGGRMATEMISRELEQTTPGYAASFQFPARLSLFAPNFYSVLFNQFQQTLLPSGNLRTNVQHDLFFLTRENQNWKGIGYFVRANDDLTVTPVTAGAVGTLYRFEMTQSAAQFSQLPGLMYRTFDQTRQGSNPTNYSKVLDGVIGFKVRAYDRTNNWLTPYLVNLVATNYAMWTNSNQGSLQFGTPAPAPPYVLSGGEVPVTYFFSNAVPAYVEFELGVLEQPALNQYKSIPILTAQANFLARQAGRVHVFRQRVAVRNVDPSAYQ